MWEGRAVTASPAARSPRQVRRAVVASVIGNGLEWFDFLIYGFFTPFIAAAVFPSDDPAVSLLLTWATFAIGFLVRPLSGVVLGLYADRAGRLKALSLMIGLMAVGTLIVGLTPSYASIGLAAPALVIFARVLQGISVGGEYAGATSMLVEYAPPGRRSLFGSFQMMSQAVSLTLASLAAWSLNAFLSDADLADWGWRVPFVLGALIGPIGVWMRLSVAESPEFEAAARTAAPRPRLLDILKRDGREMAVAIGVVVPVTLSVYVWTIYMPGAAARGLGLNAAIAPLSTLASGLALLVLVPFAGMVGDRVSGWRLYAWVLAAFALGSAAAFAWVLQAPSWTRLVAAQLALAPVIALIWGLSPAMLAGLFATRERSTGMAIGYNLGVILFGGLAPFTLAWLSGLTGDPLVPAWYVLAACAVGLLLMMLRRREAARSPR